MNVALEGLLMASKSILPEIFKMVMIPISASIGTLLAVGIKKLISSIDDTKYRRIAESAVRWVEQKYKKLESQKKFDFAKEYMAQKLGKKLGAKISDKDVEVWIEEACKNLDIELGNSASSVLKQ